jgi:hypothetical protein
MKKTVVAIFAMALLVVCAATAQKVSFDLKLSTPVATSDYFNWKLGNTPVNDSFDAASGASKAQTTEKFNAVRWDTEATKRPAVPVTLREFILYPLSDATTNADANVTVENVGKDVRIRFVNRGRAHQILAKGGKADLNSSFSSGAGFADNIGGKFTIKAEFSTTGAASTDYKHLDWNKITLVLDAPAVNASRHYTGSLTAAYKGNVLTLKGDLTEAK